MGILQSKDGDIIDCVDIYKQPAFDHRVLKNHNIQVHIFMLIKSLCVNLLIFFVLLTIPIRRVGGQDLLRANSLDSFGKKFPYESSKLGTEVNSSISKTFHKQTYFCFGFQN